MKINKNQILMLLMLLAHALTITTRAAETSSEQGRPEVVVETSIGNYTLELYPDKAPKTVENFLRYVDEGFYTNSVFHRVIPRFVVQGGGFGPGMVKKSTHAPIINESDNGLKNTRATISMARTGDPNSATSQFFINVVHNIGLDYRQGRQGYAVFGKVIEGMDVVDKIIKSPTKTVGPFQDVPKQDIMILSAYRKGEESSAKVDSGQQAVTDSESVEPYQAGVHYTLLDEVVATRDDSKIEVIEMFSYGCPHCYEMESTIKAWSRHHQDDVDFWTLPAVWNRPMNLLARAFYVSQELDIIEQTHLPLFSEIVGKQRKLDSEYEIADFFEQQGADKQAVLDAFYSDAVMQGAREAEQRVKMYKPAGVPEIIINGKYRIDRMRAGGLAEMLVVADYLIEKERALTEQ